MCDWMQMCKVFNRQMGPLQEMNLERLIQGGFCLCNAYCVISFNSVMVILQAALHVHSESICISSVFCWYLIGCKPRCH